MAPKPVDRNKLEYASHPPSWVIPLRDMRFEDGEREVIEFFLVSTPCKYLSAREVLLTAYGWESDVPAKDGYLCRRLMEVAGLREHQNFFVGSRREDMKRVFLDAQMGEAFYEKHVGNRVAYLANGNLIMSLFRVIRNSFAHSRFNVVSIEGERYFVMENGLVAGDTFEVKARLLLRSSTLLKWIDVIENESSIAIAEKRQKEEDARKEHEALLSAAVEAMQGGKIAKKEDFAEVLRIDKRQIGKLVNELKREHGAEYSRSEHRWMVS